MPHGASSPPDWQSCCPMERVHFPGSERMLASHGTTPAEAPPNSGEGNIASASHSLDCSSSGLHNMFVGSCSPLLAACLEGTFDPGSQSPFARVQQQGGTTTTAAEVKAVSTSRPFFKTRLSSSKERAVSTVASPPRQRNIPVRSHSVSGSSVKAQFASLKAAEMEATKGSAQGRQGQSERKATPLRLRPFPTEGASPRTMQPREEPTSPAEVASPRSMQTILEEPTEPEAELPASGLSSPHVKPSLHTSSRPTSQPVPKHSEPGSTPPLQQGCPSSGSAQGSPRTPRRMLPGKTARADVNVALELEKLMAPGRMSGVAQSLSQQLAKICKRWF